MTVGETREWERSFSVEQVRDFARLSGDEGRQHREVDALGRLMVHGLLTLSLSTKMGGDMNFVVREFHAEFLRPVWSGDRVRCVITFTAVEPAGDRVHLECSISCVNQHGKEVLRGRAVGFVPSA